MRGQDLTLFSGLNWWWKALIGLAFGIVLLVLLLLPNGLGEYLMIAALVLVLIASIGGFALARFGLDRAWGPIEVRRVGTLVVWSAIVLALAIDVMALLWRSLLVLWLWTVPAGLAWFAWMVFALERSMPRFGPRGFSRRN